MMRARTTLVVLVAAVGCGGQVVGDPTGTTTRPPGPIEPLPPPEPRPTPAPTATATSHPTPTAVSYEAAGYIGGIDRLTIIKRDAARDLCFGILLIDAGGTNGFGIATPQPWQVQSAWASKGASSCQRFPAQSNGVQANKGSGSLSFVGPGPYSCRLDVDATLYFGPSPGMPSSETLRAQNLFVDGFCARDAGGD